MASTPSLETPDTPGGDASMSEKNEKKTLGVVAIRSLLADSL